MLIIENPLVMLIIALIIMICFLIFFKIVNFFENIKVKSKPKSDKKASIAKSEKVSESKDDNANKIKVDESEKSEDIPFDSKSMTNYLYDRFVVDPTIDDQTKYKSNISGAFISEEKYSEIRNNKVNIKVEPVGYSNYQRNRIYDKINELTNNNRQEKEKLLDEFQNLSKEMKLLLIENIMQKID